MTVYRTLHDVTCNEQVLEKTT